MLINHIHKSSSSTLFKQDIAFQDGNKELRAFLVLFLGKICYNNNNYVNIYLKTEKINKGVN